ncbi:unnamed protein product [Ixodes persulcatus]
MFSQSRALAKQLYKNDKQKQENADEQALLKQPNDLWKLVKKINKSSTPSSIVLRDDNGYCSEPTLVANVFAKHCSACFSATDIPLTSPDIRGGDFLSCNPITECEVMEAV